MLKFHDIYLWHHYPSQRDRLITQYAAELREGFTLQFGVPVLWGTRECQAVAREFSEALAAAGAPNGAYVHTETIGGLERVVKMYSIMVEAA